MRKKKNDQKNERGVPSLADRQRKSTEGGENAVKEVVHWWMSQIVEKKSLLLGRGKNRNKLRGETGFVARGTQ